MATQREVRDWLGDFADEASPEQMDRMVGLFATIEQRWPDPDDRDDQAAALTGAVQIVLGDDTLDAIAGKWHQAKQAEREAMAVLTGALLASYTGARTGPGSEADLISRSGAARMTVRKALGR